MNDAPAIETALGQSLNAALEQVPPRLAESIRYGLLGPGKRMRPRLTLASARMVGLDAAAASAAAVAVEMLHCFTLIHDDLPCMDDDDVRRGRPSNHKRFGEPTALLAGDALLALAFETLACAPAAPDRVVAAIKRLAHAAGPRGVIGGQAAEMSLWAESSLEELKSVHSGKTGALFEAALALPADLAGASPAKTGALQAFAAALGAAFQIADDLEDGLADGPASILHYLPPAQARDGAVSDLAQACSALERAFAGLAVELLALAQDVRAKLEMAAR